MRHRRILTVTWAGDGRTSRHTVYAGSARWARILPVAVGKALAEGAATATLDYDGLARTAVLRRGRYYMRLVTAQVAA